MWGIIATWRMALEGVQATLPSLAGGGSAGDAIEQAIKAVEDFPYYKSVGYGGLPNRQGQVELDAAYMDGNRLDFGAVCGIQDIANPIGVARRLSQEPVNNVLVAQGARQYALDHGFEAKEMLTDRAQIHYHNRQVELAQEQGLAAYDGHDTVGMVALDGNNHMVAGTSTSGLFMKHPGRVGDSPIIGSGLYVDSQIGGATATGLGEDLMKGVLSYAIVQLMAAGYHPQEACEKAVHDLDRRLRAQRGQAGDLSVVAMNAKGEWGAATNIDNFSFVVASKTTPLTVYRLHPLASGQMELERASQEWLDDYVRQRMRPLEVK